MPYHFTTPPAPFKVSFPDSELEDLKDRIRAARWPEEDLHPDHGEEADAPFDLYNTSGPPLAWMKKTAKVWREEYDWRKEEDRMNSFPQFQVNIDGLDIHFIHQRSEVKDAIPLMLIHGWPGCFAEFLDCIPLLTAPKPSGRSFHVIIPSQPGFTFSSSPKTKNWNMDNTAEVFDKLMQGLGYWEGYAVQGGDWGSITARCIASAFSERCKAVHLNFCPALAPGIMKYIPPSTTLVNWMPRFLISNLERERLLTATRYLERGSGYYAIQSTTPGTAAYGLNDSPIGTLAWLGEKYMTWQSESSRLNTTAILTNCTLYYLTRTNGTSMLPYRNNPHFVTYIGDPKYYIGVPFGLSIFPKEIGITPKWWAARTGKMMWYKESEKGGHFAALEEPEIFCEHLAESFAVLWPSK